jgi:hypothetical protein
MLDGIERNRIIVGAYVDRQGGVCPMLAAHRHGRRTSLASFARAWDRYTHAGKGPRPATERELRTLRVMLEASIALDDGTVEELQRMGARRNGHGNGHGERPKPRDTGERDRSAELRGRHGWAWLRPFRRYDEYELALDEVRKLERERQRELERV